MMTGDPMTNPDIKHLSADDLFWERVEAARRMSPAEKIEAGFRLYREGCARIAYIIRNHFPRASEQEVQKMLSAILRFCRRLDIP